MRYLDTPQSVCRFACAYADITPPVGMYHRMWGAARHDRSTGIHRPLRVTVAVFEAADAAERHADTLQVLVALDHCVMGAAEMDRLLDRLTEMMKLPREAFLVVFSHTHGAGLLNLDRVDLPGGDLLPAYLDTLADTAADLVWDVCSWLEEVTIVYGRGSCTLAAHRDYPDADGGQIVCGFNPAGKADDTVLVARISTPERTRATVVNYACHPTTLAWDNTLVSPDYPGAMRELVEGASKAPCLFLQGASGDLGPREGFVGDVEVADRNGRQLGHAALAALEALPPPGTRYEYTGAVVSGATIGTWAHRPLPPERADARRRWQVRRWTLPLPYRDDLPSKEVVDRELADLQEQETAARSRGEEGHAQELRALAERKRRLRTRLGMLPEGDAFPLQVVLWRMGDGFWLGIQGEHYHQLQTNLRTRFPGVAIVVAAIAFDWRVSYLPPAEVYGQGIYQEQVAVVAPGSLERVIEEVSGAIQEMLAQP